MSGRLRDLHVPGRVLQIGDLFILVAGIYPATGSETRSHGLAVGDFWKNGHLFALAIAYPLLGVVHVNDLPHKMDKNCCRSSEGLSYPWSAQRDPWKEERQRAI